MPDFGDRSSEKYTESIENVECPFCHEAEVRVTFVAGYTSWGVSRISAGAKRTRYYHDPKIRVNTNCPNCKAPKADIKEAIESGSSRKSHEDRLRRLKEAGIPTRIEG